jgi:hypothetical protein
MAGSVCTCSRIATRRTPVVTADTNQCFPLAGVSLSRHVAKGRLRANECHTGAPARSLTATGVHRRRGSRRRHRRAEGPRRRTDRN